MKVVILALPLFNSIFIKFILIFLFQFDIMLGSSVSVFFFLK